MVKYYYNSAFGKYESGDFTPITGFSPESYKLFQDYVTEMYKNESSKNNRV